MRPAPWTHPDELEEYLSKHEIPGHFDEETNEYIPLPPQYQIHRGEELVEIFENEEYGGYGLRATQKLAATESDLCVARIPALQVLNRGNIELRYGDRPNRYHDLLDGWAITVCLPAPFAYLCLS